MTFCGVIYTEALKHWCFENLPAENSLTREQTFFGWFWEQSKFFRESSD